MLRQIFRRNPRVVPYSRACSSTAKPKTEVTPDAAPEVESGLQHADSLAETGESTIAVAYGGLEKRVERQGIFHRREEKPGDSLYE